MGHSNEISQIDLPQDKLYTETQHQAPHVGFSLDMSSIINSNLINFIIVVAFVIWLIKKFNLSKAIENKQLSIKEKITSAEDSKVTAEKELDGTKEKVKNTGKETDEIITNAADIANTLVTKSSFEAENESKELEKRAEFTIQNFNNNVSEKIKHQVASTALKIAENHIRTSIDEKKHKQLINEFIDDLENLKVG